MSIDCNFLNVGSGFTKVNSMYTAVMSLALKLRGCIFYVDSYCDVIWV